MVSSTVAFTRGDTQTCMQAVDFSSSRGKDQCMDFLTTSNLIKDILTAINPTPTNITPISVGILEGQSQGHHAYMAAG